MDWLSSLLLCLPAGHALASTRPNHPPPSPVLSSPEPPPKQTASQPRHRPAPRRATSLQQLSKQEEREARKRKRAWEDWERDYSSGDFDLERVPPPPFHPVAAPFPPTIDTRPLHLPPALFPPCAPQPGPDDSLRQRTVNRLEMGASQPEKGFAPRSTTPPRPRKSSKRPQNPPPLPPSPPAPYLPSPPLTPPDRSASSTSSPTQRPALAFPSPSTSTPTSSSIARPTLSTLQSSRSLIQHPFCRDIVSEALETFESNAALLSILDDDKLVFLANSDCEQDPASIPKQASFCVHTVLNGDRGFVVLNAATDWRFANNVLVVQGGVRFYAGAPIFASTDLRDPNALKVAVGTLCLTDPKPRDQFSTQERAELAQLAASASSSIDNWARSRPEAKIARLDAAFSSWKNGLPPLPTSPMVSSGPLPSPSVEAPSEPGGSRRKLSLPSNSFSPLAKGTQTVFDSATFTIASSLSLPLVYILSIVPASPSTSPTSAPASSSDEQKYRLSILSLSRSSSPSSSSSPPCLGFNIPLHLAALSATEGGVLYENASYLSTSPSSPTLDGSGGAAGVTGRGETRYSGGILLGVQKKCGLERRKKQGGMDGGGTVLAAFKSEEKRVFVKEELAFLRRVVEVLADWV